MHVHTIHVSDITELGKTHTHTARAPLPVRVGGPLHLDITNSHTWFVVILFNSLYMVLVPYWMQGLRVWIRSMQLRNLWWFCITWCVVCSWLTRNHCHHHHHLPLPSRLFSSFSSFLPSGVSIKGVMVARVGVSTSVDSSRAHPGW